MRRGLASMLMGLSLLVASAGWAGLLFGHSVLDGSRSQQLTAGLMTHEGMRTVLVDRLGEGMERYVSPDEPMSRQELRTTAAAALADPLATTALQNGLSEAHLLGLADTEVEPTFSHFDVNEAIRHALIAARPSLRGQILVNPLVRVRLPIDGLTWFAGLKSLVDRFAVLSLALGLVGFATTFVIAEEPADVMRRAARWILVSAIIWMALGPVFATLVRFSVPSSYIMAAAAMETVLRSMRTPAIVMASFGMGLLSMSYLAPAIGRRRGALLLDRARGRVVSGPLSGALPTTNGTTGSVGVTRSSVSAVSTVDGETVREHSAPPGDTAASGNPAPTGGLASRLSAAWMEGHGYLDDDRVAPFFSGSPREP